MNIKKKVTGFTLVEIMITVAIIGILASIAIPSYINYIKKANAREIVEVYDLFRIHMMDFHIKNGRFPSKTDGGWKVRNGLAGLPDKESFESDIIQQAWITDDSGIKILLQDTSLSESNSNRFLGKGEKVGGRFVWYCNYKAAKINGWKSTVDDKYLPARCRDN